MSINTDFYGLEADWITVSNARYDVKKAAWTDSATAAAAYGSLDTLVRSPIYNPDNLATVPLDSSIIPWKVGENSKIFQRKYCELSFPNHTSSTPVIADYFNQSATYKESDENAIKNVNGFRFFPAYYIVVDTSGGRYIDNPWDVRYSPYNYKNEFLNGTTGTAPYKSIYPIVSFDYSKTVATVEAALIPKVNLDDYASISNDGNVNKYYNNKNPNYQSIVKDLNTLTDSDLVSNYLVGFLFKVYSGGDSQHAGISITLVPFDEHLAVPASQWGGDTGQGYPYQKDFTCYTSWIASDSDRIIFCQLGGATSYVNPANCGVDGAEPATYNAQYYETKGMRTMNTDDFEGEGLEVGSWTITTNTGSGSLPNGRVLSWYIPKCYNNLTVAQIKTAIFKELAYLGFWFTDDIYYARYVDMTNHPEKYYLPEINSAGVTTGNYKAYSEASEEINFDWNTDVYEKTPYDPTKDNSNDPNNYDNNTTILNTDALIPSYFTTPYVMNATKVIATAEKFYDKIDTDFTSDLWSAKTLYTNNPIDAVISLMYFPFHLEYTSRPQLIHTQQRHLVFGAVDLESVAEAVLSSSCILDFGKCTYFPNFGIDDFRNYEPYCKGELYIPYCGSVAINPSEFLNKTISVKMIVDLRNGSCLALVFRDNLVIETASGQIGITIPISGLQSQTLASAEIQAKTAYQNSKSKQLSNIAKTAIDLVGNSMSGNVFGMLNSIANQSQIDIGDNNLYKSKFELEHIQIPFSVKGSASSATALINEQRCRFILYRPIMLENDLTVFAHQNGFATLEHDTLNNYTGFTMCDTADLSGINCTKSEKNLIMNHLRNGVYL